MKKRHLKSKGKKTWTNLRVDIKRICEDFNIPKSEFSEVSINLWAEIETKIWRKFSTRQNSEWRWQTLKEEYSAASIDYQKFKLDEFFNLNEKLWILLGETVRETTKCWVYEGTLNGLNKVFLEAGWRDDVVVVSKKYKWIFIINHYGIMIGTGEMKDKIENSR